MRGFAGSLVDPDRLASVLVRLCHHPDERELLRTIRATTETTDTVKVAALEALGSRLRVAEDEGLITIDAVNGHDHRLSLAPESALVLEMLEVAHVGEEAFTQEQLEPQRIFESSRDQMLGRSPLSQTEPLDPLDLLILGLMVRRVVRASLAVSDMSFLHARAVDLYRLQLNHDALDRPGVDRVSELHAPSASLFKLDDGVGRPERASSMRLVGSASMYALAGMTHLVRAELDTQASPLAVTLRFNSLSRDTLAEALSSSSDTFEAFAIADWEARALFSHRALADKHVVLMGLPAQLHIPLARAGDEAEEFLFPDDTTAVGGFRRVERALHNLGKQTTATTVAMPDVLPRAASRGGVALAWEPLGVASESQLGLVRMSRPIPHGAFLIANRAKYLARKRDFDCVLRLLRRAWMELASCPETALPYMLRDQQFTSANVRLFADAGLFDTKERT